MVFSQWDAWMCSVELQDMGLQRQVILNIFSVIWDVHLTKKWYKECMNRSVFMTSHYHQHSFVHSFPSAFVRSGTDAGLEGLTCYLYSNSSQRWSVGLRSEQESLMPTFLILYTTHKELKCPEIFKHSVKHGIINKNCFAFKIFKKN